MARIRTTKPEFWGDDIVGSVSRDARLLFVATWNFADDEGLIRWSPDYLKPEVFRYDQDLTLEDVAGLMRELEDAGFVYAYSTSRARSRIGFIVNFRRHQRVDKPQGAKLPVPNWRDPAVAMVYARRDGFVCRHCKEAVNEQFASSSQWRRFDPVCELVKPRSEGGNDDPTNIGVVHVMCAKDFHPDVVPPDPGPRDPRTFQDDSTNVPGTLQDRSSDRFEGSEEALQSAPGALFDVSTESLVLAGQNHSKNVPGTFGAGKEGIRERKGKEKETTPTAPAHADAPLDEAAPTPAPRKRGAAAERGTRVPEDFRITPDMEAWGRDNCPHIADPVAATAEFVDYWRGIPGAKGVKLDWIATWRNRMRVLEERWQEYHAAPTAAGSEIAIRNDSNVVQLPRQRPSTTDQRVAQAKAAGQRFAAAFRAAQANTQGAV